MGDKSYFCNQLAPLGLNKIDLATALLWYNNKFRSIEDSTASEIANDLHDEGFAKPNVTYLKTKLKASRKVIKGKRKDSFRVNRVHFESFDKKYKDFVAIKKTSDNDSILPTCWFSDTGKKNLINLCTHINGCFDHAYYDGCAIMCRRLMEVLLVEVYCSAQRYQEILDENNRIMPLEKLIGTISSDNQIHLNRNTTRILTKIKKLGDTASHHRTHITDAIEIEDIIDDYRRVIQELLALSGLR